MTLSPFEFNFGSPFPMDSMFRSSSSPSYSLIEIDGRADCVSAGFTEAPTLLSQLLSAVHTLQSQVAVMADSIMADRRQRAADRAAAEADMAAANAAALVRREAERASRADEQRCAIERFEALTQAQAKLLAKVAVVKAASTWICPVCHEPLEQMRSFKSHIKRLFEYQIIDHGVDSRKRKCFLQCHLPHHTALVALSAGDNFVDRARYFARELWHQVQSLTSSDDVCPDFVGRGASIADCRGICPQ
jgi:hypothetical protein